MRLTYRTLRLMAQGLFVLYGRGRLYGLHNVPERGPVVLASNHQSYFDPILIGLPVCREVHFMARDSLFRNRYFSRLITHLNAFPVKRGTADLGAIKEALRRLKTGGVLLTFPEGTRTRDGRVGRVRPGIVAFARRAKCPIVPTIVEGAHEIWPRHRRLPGLARIWIEYGPPIGHEELSGMEPDTAAALVNHRLWDMHNALRRRIGRTPYDYDQACSEQDRAPLMQG